MSERERKIQAMKRLLISAREATLNADEEAAYILNNGGDVELPKYEPGQHARVVLDGSWVLGERHPANTGWLIPGDNGLFHDDEVTDVEPVVVLTADDVRELGEFVASRAHDAATQINVRDFFRERGLDL